MTLWNGASSILAQVRIFYQNIQSCVINNGLASEYFYVGAKCETGRPPAYLSILALETLAISKRENSEMQRIKIGNNETNLYDMQTIPVFSVFWRPKPSRGITVRAHKAQKRSVRRFRSRLLMLSEGGFLVIIGSLV